MRAIGVILLLAATAGYSGEMLHLGEPTVYHGMCDASGGVVVNSNRFIVANDEDNVLRVYDSHAGGPPVQEFNMNSFLELEPGSPETDLEAGARIGDRAYWMSSHGRNANGKRRPNRCRFFATDISVRGDLVELAPVGRPCKTLLESLLRERSLKRFGLARASKRTPKEPEALDIEGLSATPDGGLLIGFRNPIPDGKALLVPLLNPNEVIQDKAPSFGAPIQLDLDGLGIRDITLWGREYFIIAGPYDGTKHFEFFRWSGPGRNPEKLNTERIKHFTPEALLIYAPMPPMKFQVLSDDGTRLVDGSICKELKDPFQRIFRSFWLNEQ